MLGSLPPLSRILSVVMLIAGIVVVGVLFFRVMAGFFVPLFLAALLVVIFRPIYQDLLRRFRFRRRLAAGTTTALILLVVLLPIILVISIAASQFTSTVSQVDVDALTRSLDRTRKQVGLSLSHPEKFRRLDYLADRLDAPIEQSPELDSNEVTMNPVQLKRRLSEAKTLITYLDLEMQSAALAVEADEPWDAKTDADPDSNVEATESSADGSDRNPSAPSDPTLSNGDIESEDPAAATVGSDLGTDSAEVQELTRAVMDGRASAAEYLSPDGLAAVTRLSTFESMIEERFEQTSKNALLRIASEEEYHRQSVIASAAIRSWMRSVLGGTLRSQLRLLANPSAEDFKELLNRGRTSLQPRFVSFTSRTGSFLLEMLIGLVVLVIAVYFFLIDGHRMTRTLMRLSPLDDEYERELLDQFDRTSRAVVLASVASALVQGVLAAIAYWFIGFQGVILLFLLTTMMSLVPFLGAASVWVPCVVYLAAVEQRIAAAIGLAIYGATIVSSVDNLIKMYVLHGRSTLHPLLALLSVLGGLTVFGPIGIVVGPMVVVFLQTLLEILNHELENEAQVPAEPAAAKPPA